MKKFKSMFQFSDCKYSQEYKDDHLEGLGKHGRSPPHKDCEIRIYIKSYL